MQVCMVVALPGTRCRGSMRAMLDSLRRSSQHTNTARLRPSATLIVLIAYVGFIGLGLPAGALGVAWPSIRAEFGLRLDAIGALLTAVTIGSLLSSFASGPAANRFGLSRFLLAGTLSAVLGLAGYALAPGWWALVACGLLVGASAGAIDAGLNTYFAAHHGPRLMTWLHAAFGLGAALSPMLMTALVGAGLSWRWGYAAIALLQILVALGIALTLSGWTGPDRPHVSGDPSAPGDRGTPEPPAAASATLRLPVMWFSIALLLMIAGSQATATQWPYSLFTEARAVAPATAGLWVGIHWATLTGARVLYGLAGNRLKVNGVLRFSTIVMVVGAVLLWWNPTDWLSFIGLALMGVALAPTFPLLQLVTPARLGRQHAANAIGFQTAAGYIGFGLAPGLAGILAQRWGLETIGPYLTVCVIGMLLLHELLLRSDRAKRTVAAS